MIIALLAVFPAFALDLPAMDLKLGRLAIGSLGAKIEDPVEIGFHDVPNDARMRMYWRIFGPGWQKSEINYQLDQVRSAGIGGLMAYFMYPFSVDNPASGAINQRFLSPEFLDTFAFAAQAAHQRGLRFGVNGGTGWPYGGANVSIENSAHKLHEVQVRLGSAPPKLGANDRLVAAFAGNRLLDLHSQTGFPVENALKLYVESPTRQQVKRASYGAEGFVVDHFSKPALEDWLSSTVKPVIDAGGGLLDGLGCDSLEVYSSNWARDLPEQFKRRRGYDLLPNLPLAFGDTSSQGDAVRFDYWRTLMELTEERFTEPLAAWSKKHNVALEMEAYGTPPNPMTAFRNITIPTGEHYEWAGFAIQKFVASAAHMAKRNIIGCEAWTWAGLPNRLADTLSDIKLVSDMEFLCGSNDLTGVDYPYSPRSAGQPGWQPYYGPTMNENNPQWEAFPGLVQYINRCQWMLRQGNPTVSVAVYLPVEDALSHGGMDQMQLDFLIRDHFVTGKATSEFGLQNSLVHRSALLQGLFTNGLDYDGIDLWALQKMARQQGSHLVAGTSSYAAVVLPNMTSIDRASAEKLKRFVIQGGLVVAVRQIPHLAAGKCTASQQAAFDHTLEEIFGRTPVPGTVKALGKGHGVLIKLDEEVGPMLADLVPRQISFDRIPNSVGFVQRRLTDRDIFFLANVKAEPVTLNVRFPSSSRSVELWDAESGKITQLAPNIGGGFTLKLSGRGSAFLVVRAVSHAPIGATSPIHRVVWSPNWKVSFEGPDHPSVMEVNKLESWTQWPGGRHFSGIGVYEADLDWSGEKNRAVLAFARVCNSATVWVNGKLAGYVYNFPNEIEVSPFLKRGVNHIKIRVGNLLVNRFIGLPDDDLAALRAKYGARFQRPEEKQLMKEPAPSGLIGKVYLVTD